MVLYSQITKITIHNKLYRLTKKYIYVIHHHSLLQQIAPIPFTIFFTWVPLQFGAQITSEYFIFLHNKVCISKAYYVLQLKFIYFIENIGL